MLSYISVTKQNKDNIMTSEGICYFTLQQERILCECIPQELKRFKHQTSKQRHIKILTSTPNNKHYT